MSLFDRYFSQKNKDYIFNLLCSTFEREKGQSFMNNRAFKEHYQMIYPRVFDRSASDDLVSLNKELIDAMDECISNEKFTNHGQRSNFHNPKNFHKPSNHKRLWNIYSSDRIDGSIGRYDYLVYPPKSLHSNERTLMITKITLPRDPKFPSLFSGLTCQIEISCCDQSIKSVFDIANIQTIDHKEYITYHPQTKDSLLISDNHPIHIKIQDRYGSSSKDRSDVANIIQTKKFQEKGVCLKLSNTLQEPIGFLGKDGYEKNITIVVREDPFLLIESTDMISDQLIEMKSQNHIVCEIIETPKIVRSQDKYSMAPDLIDHKMKRDQVLKKDRPMTDKDGSDGSPSQDPPPPS